MVTSDFQGRADVKLRLHIGQNGLVEQVEIANTTSSGIGERVAAARNWIFLPYVKDGSVHTVNTEVKLQVQAIKNK